MKVQSGATATAFTLERAGGYSGITAPSAGTSIAFYDNSLRTFAKKKLLTVTGSGPWVCVVDTSLGVSNETYEPYAGQGCSPWSDSLSLVADGINAAYDKLGPGEQTATIPEDGARMQRVPFAPAAWPHVITDRMLENALDIPEILDRSVGEYVPTTSATGVPGLLSTLLLLDELTVFAL